MTQNALWSLHNHAVGGESLEDYIQVLEMLLDAIACHQDIVDIDENAGNVAEDFVHESLEILASIFKPEWRAREDKQAKRSNYGRLGNVFVRDGYLVQFGKDGLALQLGGEIL